MINNKGCGFIKGNIPWNKGRKQTREELLIKWKEYYQKNKGKIKERDKKYREKNKEHIKKQKKEYGIISRAYIKKQVFDHYGWSCKCCGEDTKEFLTIDHINGGGTKHRKEIKGWATHFYRWLVKNNFPKGYQVLCMNCNFAKGHFGICPHMRDNL